MVRSTFMRWSHKLQRNLCLWPSTGLDNPKPLQYPHGSNLIHAHVANAFLLPLLSRPLTYTSVWKEVFPSRAVFLFYAKFSKIVVDMRLLFLYLLILNRVFGMRAHFSGWKAYTHPLPCRRSQKALTFSENITIEKHIRGLFLALIPRPFCLGHGWPNSASRRALPMPRRSLNMYRGTDLSLLLEPYFWKI